MATREQAHSQYFDLARSLGIPLNSELENDFQGSWNSASLDSHAYSGAEYQKTWEQVWPEAQHNLYSRAAPTEHRGVDSQSEMGNKLYGSGTGNKTNLPGAPLVTGDYVPATVSIVTTGARQSLTDTPAVGPVGLAYPDDPVNYSTMVRGENFGYSTGGTLPSGIYASSPAVAPAGMVAAPADNKMLIYVLLAGMAVAAYVLWAK